MSLTDRDVAMIGVGVMGEAILSALVQAVDPSQVRVTTHTSAHARTHEEKYGVRAAASNTEAVSGAGTVLVAVKPKDFAAVLQEIAPSLEPDAVVISVAAGLPTSFLEQHLDRDLPVVRVMPNTPVTIGQGVCVLSGGSHATAAHLGQVAELLAKTGTVLQVQEQYQDAVTSISGSGPAYVFYIIDALAEAGVLGGLPREMSQQLAAATVAGAGAMAAESAEHPVVLREKVSSPAGTTVTGVRQLDDHGVRSGVIAAAEAARKRSEELGRSLADG